MKNFQYAAPRTEKQVLALLSERPGETEILAGGTDLVGLMKKMIVTPELVVNVMEVDSMKIIEPDNEGNLLIGAAVTLDDLLASPYLADYPAVTDAILGINSMQLQSQGTIGGELCQRPRCWFYRNGQQLLDGDAVTQGDNQFHAIFGNEGPAKFVSSSRIAPALLALDARLRVVGPQDEDQRPVPVRDFYQTPRHDEQRENILLTQQFVSHIVLPPAHSNFNATYEVRQGAGPEFPLAAAAASLGLDTGGRVADAAIVLGQVAPVPWMSRPAIETLLGQRVTHETAEQAGQAAAAEATPLSQNEYKVQLTKVAVKRSILKAVGLESGGF